ncbi:glycosyltransferase family 2 protein [Tateyamaria sp. SN3-11]|uniref:glycosyltransferase family 2 protein n=1 Tax=Tateyamaria sp. SN3-11 TaxID=3092147 RepID=UPI0039EB837F
MATVHILLATHNGAKYLDQQLQSFLTQDHDDWQLWVSDDRSTDTTRDVVERFAAAHPGRVRLVQEGPGAGSAANFLSLLARPELAGQWIAFSDQDDVWMPHKLARAVDRLGTVDGGRGVYASRTIHTDANLVPKGPSRLHRRPFEFGNALVQNVLAGNTIVLPPEGAAVVRSSLATATECGVPFHDWWVYQICAGAGLHIINDPEPGLYYRQHADNAMGASVARRMDRVKQLHGRVFAGWIDCNLSALDQSRDTLRPECAALLDQMIAWRATPRLRRVTPAKLGLYRQTAAADRILHMLAFAGRI